MESTITGLVEQYESGKLTRRQLVAGLGSLVGVLGGSGQLLAQAAVPASTFEGVSLNHFVCSAIAERVGEYRATLKAERRLEQTMERYANRGYTFLDPESLRDCGEASTGDWPN